MNKIWLLLTIIFGLILPTIQLFCSTNCTTIQVNYSDPFIEPFHHNSCLNDTSINICKGRITAYYIGKSNYPKYINYTFGKIDDVLERKNENDINKYALKNLTRYQVIINPKIEETQIISDIYCTTDNECALDEIKKLFNKYNNQINPFYELKSLFYSNLSPDKLYCYDITNDTSKLCTKTNDNNYPVCLSYFKELKHECSSGTDLELHEEFILTSPDTMELNLKDELIKCNQNNCNSFDKLAEIQKIARDYAYGTVIMKNNAHKQRNEINQIFFILILIVFFV
ncbi:unnamed protein product [Adineta steineri]|uniref:Uncharacterized protein n=1 Tax=Adineta steineri TaxID=433720 RepID=A0A819B6D8_9BILA|nr:unnamed protein product [Adineta steineri]CAF3967147.1 unnamed protein product [Adineta steineri]